MDIYKNIADAWFRVCRKAIDTGREYLIDRGSFEGHYRYQLDHLAFRIECPEARPLGIQFKGIAVSNDADIECYFCNYLLTGVPADNEQYTYGQRIAPYIEIIGDMLRKTPGTNQATIEVGRPEDILLEHPPCLRVLSWKAAPAGLQLSSFWRSWDLAYGLPVNLGGLQRLNETVAELAGIPPGELVCYSDGGHVYDYCKSVFD